MINESIELFLESFYSNSNLKGKKFTFFGGALGVNWLYQYYINQGVVEKDEAFVEKFNEFILKKCIAWKNSENYDLMYGIVGAGVYFLECHKNNDDTQYLEFIYTLLDGFSSSDKDFLWWYDSNAFTDERRIKNTIDLGVAHGMPSILSLYARIYSRIENNKLKERIKNDITKGINFLYHCAQNSPNKSSVFPCKLVDNNKFFGYPSRLGWCYGDLPIAYQISHMGVLLQDENILNFGKTLIEVVLSRDIESGYTGIKDNCICHGIAGIIIILKKIKGIKIVELEDKLTDAIYYWEQMLLKKVDDLGGLYTCFYDTDKDEDLLIIDPGLLEGVSGIGLALLPQEKYEWTTLLML